MMKGVMVMPGFDGTGPFGGGPMTGRGRGFCVYPLQRAGTYLPWIARAGRFFGRRRFGPGWRRGWGGRGRWWR